MKIDWQNMERVEPLLATVENMEACEGIHGVVMLDVNGDEWSATPGDYFWHGDGPLETDGEPNILVRRQWYFAHPLSGELV